MTYNVFSGMLNPTQSINLALKVFPSVFWHSWLGDRKHLAHKNEFQLSL